MSRPSIDSIKLLAPVPRTTTNFAPFWLVEALGYAEEEGIGYSIELVGTPKNAAEGVIDGRGDTTFVNVVFAILARDRGIPLKPYYAFVRRQNRAFSVPVESPTRELADLRGSCIGLHYDDPELFQFARAALVGGGVDPDSEVTFMTLPGSPLDAPRMAAAIRDGEVQAVWQLDVLQGMMEVEGVPLRLLPSDLIDRLAPSSCLSALDDSLEKRGETFAAFGRALAKATLFSITNPERAIEIIWDTYPDARPITGENADHVFRRELAALKVRLAGNRIDTATLPLWGAITEQEMTSWQDFLLETGALRERRDPRSYYSDDLNDAFNDFDPRPVIERAGGAPSQEA